MELNTIEANIGIELMELMSKGLLTVGAVNLIIEALNNNTIKPTYKAEIKKPVYNDIYGGEIIRFISTGEYENRSYIEEIANNFNCIMNQSGEQVALNNLKAILKPTKKQYRKRRY